MAIPADAPEEKGFILQLLDKQPEDASRLLQFLIEIQERYNFVSDQAVQVLSQRLGVSAVEIEAVISFYSFLYRKPLRYRVLFSDNISDRMAGSVALRHRLASAVKGEPDIEIGQTSCTGLCDQGPALLINGMAIAALDDARIDQIAHLIRTQTALPEWPEELFRIRERIQRCDMQLDLEPEPGAALRFVMDKGGEWLLEQLEVAGLRGRGGAGFPTVRKWRLCRDSDAADRVVVCNADEGEPGTFKDRVLLSRDASSIIEGMTLCARTIGASKGFIYLRGEYRFLLPSLEQTLRQRRADGLLGPSILGDSSFHFDIDIHLGAGAYICGEESALIESLEGKRGVPRVRPPFPVSSGYRGLPTVVNNVETFWSVSLIALKGGEWFRTRGTPQSAGTRLVSISGDCQRPGVYEYPFGVDINKILKDCGGSDAQAVQIAGAAGNLVPREGFSRSLSFEDLPTGGSFMVIGPQRNLLQLLGNFADFFRHESCGFCTPCRNGSAIVSEVIRRFESGCARQVDRERLDRVLDLMQKSSFCGLGCSAPTAFLDALEHFPDLFSLSESGVTQDPYFDLDAELNQSRELLHRQEGQHE